MSRLTKPRSTIRSDVGFYAYERVPYSAQADATYVDLGAHRLPVPGKYVSAAEKAALAKTHAAARLKVWASVVAGGTMGGVNGGGPVGVIVGGTVGGVAGAVNNCTGSGCHISD